MTTFLSLLGAWFLISLLVGLVVGAVINFGSRLGD